MADDTHDALTAETIEFLRSQDENAASLSRIQHHLSNAVPLIHVNPHNGHSRPVTLIDDRTVHSVLNGLVRRNVVERVRERRAFVYALTDERKWMES